MQSSVFDIQEGHSVPYGDQVKSFHQTFKNGGKSRGMSSFRYALIRLRNYICFLLAYVAPSNRIRVALNRWKGVHIADGAYIGMCCFLDNAYPDFIYIEREATVNAGSMILTHFNPKQHFRGVMPATVEPVLIKQGAIVAVRSIINPGVCVGEYAIVSAGSVVFEDVLDKTMVRGNPAIQVSKIRIKYPLEKV